jgi:UMF1 family MFS transporter
LVTVFSFGGIYAQGTFDFTLSEVIVFGIVLNIVAGLSALLFGFMDDRLGGKNTVLVSIVGLTAAALVGVLAPNRLWFWVAGIGIGMFVGPNQAASRSLMGRFVPEHQQAEFFGFYQFTGKITAFAGPLLLGLVATAFNSQRPGVARVVLFFLVGGVLLARVDEGAGIRAAREESARDASGREASVGGS